VHYKRQAVYPARCCLRYLDGWLTPPKLRLPVPECLPCTWGFRTYKADRLLQSQNHISSCTQPRISDLMVELRWFRPDSVRSSSASKGEIGPDSHSPFCLHCTQTPGHLYPQAGAKRPVHTCTLTRVSREHPMSTSPSIR